MAVVAVAIETGATSIILIIYLPFMEHNKASHTYAPYMYITIIKKTTQNRTQNQDQLFNTVFLKSTVSTRERRMRVHLRC